MSESVDVNLPGQQYWKKRFDEAGERFLYLKSLTKDIPACEWTPEYRRLAEAIHTMGRDVFYIGV